MSAPTAFTLTRLHENKIRTLESRVYPFFKMGVRLFTRCPRPATRLAIPDIQLHARFSPIALFRTKEFKMLDESVIAALLTLASLASSSGNGAR